MPGGVGGKERAETGHAAAAAEWREGQRQIVKLKMREKIEKSNAEANMRKINSS